jgi:hypothetical protein
MAVNHNATNDLTPDVLEMARRMARDAGDAGSAS